MNYFENIISVIFLLLFLLFITLFLLSIINSIRFKVPQVATFSSDFKVMRKGLKKYKLSGKTMADLGSGSGKVLRFFEKEFGMKTTGYEIDFGNIIISKILNYCFSTNAKIIKGDYLKEDLSKYDIIYIYGFNILMPGIEKKLWSNCKKETLIISNAFQMPNKKTIDILLNENAKEEVFIYKI